ncbi:4Fe-4S dicluster domain-containing protein [Tenacibaculum maritimum]|uniref:4Fe-4S dicluster domain-containing protein n=1 Tax=Tenacibaculum maritimum TaxID=107401 RepID=UPI001E3C4EDF|nr:4Fe-4S dicluster domain-containing protein [Tenacibaculum maritimum]MCD9562683.1 4Fe-4S dicluster domain-containing protein [Tenacibaculum maritimum]MCD9564745.1 4Fe-4S dicluster domain-containing protein [Tenacibaculum maritimum]MCD9577874.1 4Fe-4S dicluster domain-containing protein [Tenacibaculum maritimum]MCD9596758.1 4Fe-4S dicluster domain-containing protein [Tenacibaculum maritimum]MCD9612396.1 4Fe-4S dicluster domain-containing protein [Tenacibaculum maritimum]
MSINRKKWFTLNLNNKEQNQLPSCSCDKQEGTRNNFYEKTIVTSVGEESVKDGFDQVFEVPMNRRDAFKKLTASLLIGAGAVTTSCSVSASSDTKEEAQIDWEEQFKGNYKLMTNEEKKATVNRLVRSYELRTGKHINMSSANAEREVLFGYAFNISKCRGYMDCINACVAENNQDRNSQMEYIRIHEIKKGKGFNFNEADDNYYHEVPAEGHFYMGTQCFHCDNPPCVKVCPVQATWREEDGLVVVDYDWCVGCRYCMAACPYDGRRFNWSTPEVPEEVLNKNQHYLGNRMRKKGVMEKCTFCVQRSRAGKNPACVEACPTGARIFGNLLDPKSTIRWVLENKKVFKLKEDLGTEPKFWYFKD